MGDWWNPFDDEPGAGLGGAVGITHPDNPAAKRGQPRAGTGPDYNNYLLGGSPDYLNQLEGQANNITGQGQTLSNEGYNAVRRGDQFSTLAAGAQGRAGAQGPNAASYDPAMYGALGSNAAGGSSQYALANQLNALSQQGQGPSAAASLEKFAASGPGPSAAQAQLQQGTNEALNSQIAMARSGSGFGESANAMQAAQGNAAGIMANNANAAAATAANEQQAFQQQKLAALSGAGNIRQGENAQFQNAQLQALGLSGQQLEAGRAADLGLANTYSQQGQFNAGLGQQNAQLRQQQMAQNDQMTQALYGQGLQSQEMGLNAANAGMNQQLAAQGLGLQGAQAQQAGTMGYEGDLTDIYGIDTGEHDKTRELNQSAGQAGLGAVAGLASAAAPALGMLSDRRAKKKIRAVSLDEHYAALADGFPGAPMRSAR